MLFRGVIVDNLSGSLDGITASHNRGGPYLRSRTIPVDPQTTQQLYNRAAMSDLYAAWVAMTTGQREQWEAYAKGITVPNRIGSHRQLIGYTAWTRQALPQYQQIEALGPSRTPQVTPPALDPSDFASDPVVTIPNLTHITIAWENTTAWENSANDDDGFIVHIGTPHTPLRRWYMGPFVPTHWVPSSVGSPPSSPITLSLASAQQPTSGQALDVRIRLFRHDRPNGRTWQSRSIAP
jgi:hypothetical protein